MDALKHIGTAFESLICKYVPSLWFQNYKKDNNYRLVVERNDEKKAEEKYNVEGLSEILTTLGLL